MTTDHHRAQAALAGQLDPTTLSTEEAAIFNDEIATAIKGNLASTNYGNELAERGITTVALDRDGHIIEQRPDGTTAVLPPA